MEGFRDGTAVAAYAYAYAYARKHRILMAASSDLSADRIGYGLTAVVSVKLDFPTFEGATRGTLGNAPVRNCIAEAVQEHLGNWPKARPERAAAVIDRIVPGTPGSEPQLTTSPDPGERDRRGRSP